MIAVECLAIHSSDACQLACDWCYNRHNNHAAAFNPYAKQALAFLYAYCHRIDWKTGKKVGQVAILGGEPLLHKEEIVELVEFAEAEYADRMQLSFGLTTNCVALDRAFSDWTLRHNVYVHLSVDGDRAGQSAHRLFPDGSSSFDIVDRNLRDYISVNPHKKNVRSTLSPQNMAYVLESMRYFLDLGIRHVALVPATSDMCSWGIEDLAMLRKCWNDLGDWIMDLWRQGIEFHISGLDAVCKAIHNGRALGYCGASRTYLGVNPNGFVVPCHRYCNQVGNQWRFGHVDKPEDLDLGTINRYLDTGFRKYAEMNCAQCGVREVFCWSSCHVPYVTQGLGDGMSFECVFSHLIAQVAQRVNDTMLSEHNPIFLSIIGKKA